MEFSFLSVIISEITSALALMEVFDRLLDIWSGLKAVMVAGNFAGEATK